MGANTSPEYQFGDQIVCIVDYTRLDEERTGASSYIFWVKERNIVTMYKAQVMTAETFGMSGKHKAEFLLRRKRGRACLCTFRLADGA
jgi:hypothetical protein